MQKNISNTQKVWVVMVVAKARKVSHGKPVYTTVHYTFTCASVHIC